MLYIWWDWKGVLYYELLPENQTVNSNKYFSQLGQLKAVLDEMCWNYSTENELSSIGIMKDHVSLMTRQKLLQFGLEVLTHLPYSLDTAPSGFFSFCFLQNSLNVKRFNFQENCKRHLKSFFAQKDIKFWEDGIIRFPEKW